MTKHFIKIFFLFLSIAGFSQNLVINPSFETFTTCPLGPGSFGIQTWVQPYPVGPGCSTADYYNACNTNGFADVPTNFLGTENALTGVAYAGIMLYETNNPCTPPSGSNYREYIEGTLSSPLVAGKTYSVSMHISLPENVMFGSDDIGIYFSNSAVNLACPPPLTSTVLAFTPQLQYAGVAVTNMIGWTLLQWTYTAVGGEQYLTIGNFKDDANTDGICANTTSAYRFAYYYIDDVSVTVTPPSSTLNTTASAINLLCNNQCSGTATAAPSSGTAPYTYLWNNGQTSVTATGLCAGNYSVLVTDAASATASATVVVNQPAAITASTTVTQTSCGNATGTANVSAAGGSPSYTYSWSSGQTVQSISNLTAGNYSVTITDANGCTQTATANISTANGPTVTATSTSTSCTGSVNGTATANTAGGAAPYTYLWSNGASTSSATGLAAGNYSVVVTDNNGCSSTMVVAVSAGAGPTVNISPDVSINIGSSANLSASGGINYSWSPAGGLSCTTCANPVADPTSTTQYCVLVTDASGCSDSACVTVYVELPCGEFYLPNAFSPNNDNENDAFKAYIEPSCVLEFKLVIYSRWGEKVFETTDVIKSWDGYLNGVVSNTAVYAYYCTAKLTNGKEIDKKGNVSLVK